MAQEVMTEAQIKAAVRERDGFRCIDCGMTNAQHLRKWQQVLHVHREIPRSEYAVGPGCVTLCLECHHKWHRRNDHRQDNQISLAIEPEWLERIHYQASLHSSDVLGYVRRAILAQVEADEKVERRYLRELSKNHS